MQQAHGTGKRIQKGWYENFRVRPRVRTGHSPEDNVKTKLGDRLVETGSR